MKKAIQQASIIISLLFPCIAMSSGDELHASQCIECHSRMTGGDGSVLYKREDRIAASESSLAARVKHCSEGAKTNWSQDQIDSVTHYLNTTYYHY